MNANVRGTVIDWGQYLRQSSSRSPQWSRALPRQILLWCWFAATIMCGVTPAISQTPGAGTPQSPPPSAAAASSVTVLADQFDKSAATVVARVNNTPITLGMVADRLRELPRNMGALPTKQLYRISLEDLIQQRSLAIKAKEMGLDKDPVTQRHIAEATEHELTNAIIQHSVPEKVTEQAIADRYAADITGKPGPEEVQLRAIVTATEAEANDALARINAGMDFATAAREFSRDSTKQSGGELDFVSQDKLAPELGAVAFALPPGQTAAYPIKSNNMWFIIKVEGRRQRGPPSLQEATPGIKEQLSWEAAREILRQARASVDVKDYGPTGQGATTEDDTPKLH